MAQASSIAVFSDAQVIILSNAGHKGVVTGRLSSTAIPFAISSPLPPKYVENTKDDGPLCEGSIFATNASFLANRNVYVVGWTTSQDFPLVNPLLNSSLDQAAFVTKFSAAGTPLLFSTYLVGANVGGRTGQGNATGTGLAVDPFGNVFLAGMGSGSTEATDSETNFPVTPGAFETTEQIIARFVAKITPDDNPALAVTQGNIVFVATSLNATNSRVLKVFNAGTQPLVFNSLAITGDFHQTNGCLPQLAAGGNCDVTVNFTPTAIGNRGGTLTITDNAAGSHYWRFLRD